MGENTEQTTNRKTETTAQMNELNKALLELKKITGISLEVSGAAPEQIEPALTQIHCLCTAYKEKYNRTDFLQGLMTGNIPHYEISDRASRLHIDPEEKRILFLIEGKHFDETSGAILKNATVLPFKNLYRSPYGNAACSHTSALPKRDV